MTAEEHPKAVLRGPDGETGPTMLAGDFAGNEETIAAGVERAEDIRGQITLIQKTLPLGMVGLGVLLLVVGGFLLRRPAGAYREDDVDVESTPTRTRVPQVQ